MMHTMRQNKDYKVWFLSLLIASLPSLLFGGSFFSEQPKTKKQQDPREQQIERDIQRRVAREVKKEKFRQSQRTIKDLIYPTKEQEEKLSKLATFVHKVPSWPFMSLFFEQRDFFQVDLHASTASQSYASHGGSRDYSRLVFGEQDITIADILLVSKLAAAPGNIFVAMGDQADFKALAPQPLIFDASTAQVGGSINYARHFCQGAVALGFQIPFVFKKHSLHLTNDMKPEIRAILAPAGNYKDLTLRELLDEILEAKGTNFQNNSTEAGVGDLNAFLHYEFTTSAMERFLIGVHGVFPTGRLLNTQNLWSPELGNGGFTQVGGFASMLWGYSWWLNPYLHTRFLYSIKANVNRRVPETVSYATGKAPKDLMVLAQNVTFNGTPTFSEQDATVRYFADNARRTKIQPGLEFDVKFGNVFERVIWNRAFLDLYYELKIKGRDYLGFRRSDDIFDASIWTHNTHQMHHRLGAEYAYQFNNFYRLAVGVDYIVAGRNVPKTLAGRILFNAEF
ncbi:hypothetical protein IPF37_00970 [bacterium]|nr:MAG: hypothetical protein IPF37_00970 [bacterium]